MLTMLLKYLCWSFRTGLIHRYVLPRLARKTQGGLNGNVQVNGRSLHVLCLGTGSPTVVLEAGVGRPASDWADVHRLLHGDTRVFAYDRAGIGRSDPAPKPRTAQQLVDDLHVLLGNARIEGPYVLVGHSLSGHYVRLYIDKYPDDVAGVVLVDCGHPERDARLLAALPPEKPEESAALKNLRRDLVEYARDPSRNREGVNVSESASQADATGGLGGLPLVVLTRGKPDWPPGLAPEIVSELEKIHLEMQGELCDLSSNSIQLVAAESGHFVQRDQPTLVADAIRRVIDTVRNGGALDRPPPEAPRSS